MQQTDRQTADLLTDQVKTYSPTCHKRVYFRDVLPATLSPRIEKTTYQCILPDAVSVMRNALAGVETLA